jgi:hypothetical protein
MKDKEFKQFLRYSQGISEAHVNLRNEIKALHEEIDSLGFVRNTIHDGLDTLQSVNVQLNETASKLLTLETHEPITEEHMDARPTSADLGLQTIPEPLTNSDVQKKITELLETHEQFKGKLFENLRKFSETQLKENTKTRTEYNTFRDVRKELNKWYISCQLIKKNLSNEQNSNSYHYLKADISYSQAVVDDHVLQKVRSDLQQTLQQADLRLKLASIEHNIAKVDKLSNLLADSNNSLVFAKSFKGVLKVHRNLNDKFLFKPRRQPIRYEHRTDKHDLPPRHTERLRTDGERRHAERFHTDYDTQELPPRHTDRFRKEFPSLRTDAEAETDEEVFENQPRRSYRPRVFERSYRPRRDQYEPEMSFRNNHRRDSEWSTYEHHDDRRYNNRDEQQHYGRPRNSEYRLPGDYETYHQRYRN